MKELSNLPTLYVDMDGVIADWLVGMDKCIHNQGYFLNLPANRTLINFLKLLNEHGIKVVIISCYLSDSDYALDEKIQWLKREMFPCEAIFVPCGESKAEYLRRRGVVLDNNSILLDDHSPNLIEWEKEGGRAVKYLNGVNGKGIKWKGERVSNDNLLDIIVE